MAGLPEITLAGILVTDPELLVSPTTGVAVAHFTVATNDGRYDPVTGERVDRGATFLRCSIGCRAAENVAESLTKGARVLVTGVLRQREWEAAKRPRNGHHLRRERLEYDYLRRQEAKDLQRPMESRQAGV